MNLAERLARPAMFEEALRWLRIEGVPTPLNPETNEGRRFLVQAVAQLTPCSKDAYHIFRAIKDESLTPNRVEYDNERVFSTITELHERRVRWLNEQQQK